VRWTGSIAGPGKSWVLLMPGESSGVGDITPPKLVLFDLDDTLCDHEASLRVRLRLAFTAAFDGRPPAEIDAIIEQSIDYSVFGTDHFADLLAPHGVDHPELIQAAIDTYVSDRYLGLVLFEEVVDVVHAVKHRAGVGMITNGPSVIQREKIARLGIGPLFPFILVSEEEDLWKPDPRIFERALERGSAEPADAVYIGDNPEHDIAGARAAGITSVWINRARREWPGGPPPDYEIGNLRELLSLFGFVFGEP
jgi:FMN hydrolase / 5-amino-6-(5-phospho-D-ribitylamino)uracil phosphatase